MAQITDRASLISEAEAYAKRSYTADRQDTFLQLAHDRIFRDCRAQENVVQATLIPTTVLVDLPDDFIDLRELSYLNGSRRVVLTSVGRHRLAISASQTGRPAVYSIIGNQVEVAPKTLPDQFTLWYWQFLPQMTANADTNVILQTFPYLYLYGFLIEAFAFIGAQDSRDQAVATYQTELQLVNGQADRSRFGEAPIIGVG